MGSVALSYSHPVTYKSAIINIKPSFGVTYSDIKSGGDVSYFTKVHVSSEIIKDKLSVDAHYSFNDLRDNSIWSQKAFGLDANYSLTNEVYIGLSFESFEKAKSYGLVLGMTF